MIRVVLPPPLRALAGVEGEVHLDLGAEAAPTQRALLDALEARYPVLRGTVRDPVTQRRRSHVRFFAGQQDHSHAAPDDPLPDAVACGREAFIVLGALSGG